MYETGAAAIQRSPVKLVQINLDTAEYPGIDELHSDSFVPLGARVYASITDIDIAPIRATPSKGLGYRGQLVVTFQDFADGRLGTYFGRYLAKNPYYLDRELILFDGFEPIDGVLDLANFKRRTYFIKSIDAGSSAGLIKIKALDILSLLDEDQAIIPPELRLKLNADITDVQTGAVAITNAPSWPSYLSHIRIEEEIISVNSSVVDTVTLGNRAQFGTEAREHSLSEKVTVCYVQEDINVVSLIYELITEFTNISPAFIDLAGWTTEAQDFLAGEDVDIVISKPTAVKNIIERLVEQAYINIWWDDENQLIRLKAIRPNLSQTVRLNTEQHILAGSHTIKSNQSDAINEVWVYYSRINWAKDDNKPENYTDAYIYVDIEAQAGLGTRKVHQIFADSIRTQASATKLALRTVSQSKAGSKEMRFHLDYQHATVKVGDVVIIESYLNQGVDGNTVAQSYLITEKEIAQTSVAFRAVASGFAIDNVRSNYALIAPNDLPDYASASQDQRNRYAYIADENNEVGGDLAYTLL